MKIIFVYNDNAHCGIADYAKNLLPELVKLVNVEVVFMPHFSVPTGSPSHYVMNAYHAYSFARKISHGDICHVQHEYALWGGVRPLGNVFPYFTAGIQIPIILTLHELAPFYKTADVRETVGPLLSIPIRPLADRYLNYLNRRMFELPRQLIVHTEEQRRELLFRGVPANKINCIPHGIPMMDSIMINKNSRQHFGLDNSRYLVIIGFISRRKGYHLAVESLKSLPKDIIIVFAGGSRTNEDKVYEDDLRQFVILQGLEERVVITGYLDMTSLKSLVKRSLFVLAPFQKASGSGSLSIALSLGKAVLAARLPEMVELADSSRAIELFNLNDPVDLAGKVKELLEHPDQVSKLENCASKYAAKMSFKEVAEQTVGLYKKLLCSPKFEQN